ncbi:nitrite reductase [Prosthecomicrobium hirschii]|uniref:nitrite reductase n=1 Tax=Prosthecodimorpha hirschii TaxID=665126 RepID=UPI00221FD716|nr:nitrite reductase [Prosthecomicrobium hirschii]MCW1841301.1 nitrite reductase [Prosthecomicrobium hirschii]
MKRLRSSPERAAAAAALWLALATAVAGAAEPAAGASDGPMPDAAALYATHCAACHGETRLGGQGPALLPVSLGRLKPADIARTIANGRAATQMPAFADTLDKGEIAALAAFVGKPPAVTPTWTEADIRASRIVHPAPAATKPVFDADPLNLFVVVEAGDHHVSILDGDRFTTLARFPSRYALHGGPKFTPDGRFVFFGSRDGWISKYDLWTLTTVAEVRAGINMRNIALSADGRWIAAANYLPGTLVLLSAETLEPVRIFEAGDARKAPSRVSAVYQAPDRNSFIAALKDVPEIWEIATDPKAAPVFTGLVHNYEKGMAEALPASAGLFALRRIAVEEPVDDFFFDRGYRHLLGAARDGGRALVVNLNVGRTVATVPMPGMPHLGAGIGFTWQGRRVIAAPHLSEGRISIIDSADWSVVKTIETAGPGFFLRSHEDTPYIWADAMMGKASDGMQIIDKRTLEVVRVLTPAPGKIAAHTEFDRGGRHALVSVWDADGALVVYDAATLEERIRLPMRKPVGKYNVFNKIRFSEGTSH